MGCFLARKNKEATLTGKDLDIDSINHSEKIFPSKISSGRYSTKLSAFENDIFNLCRNLKFRKVFSKYQDHLKRSLNKLKQDEKIIVKADKTANLYKMDVDMYKKLSFESVTTKYKKAPPDAINIINSEAETLLSVNEVKGKIRKMNTNNAFVTIKEHKSNFPYKINCRLLNPCKSSIRKISKCILDRIIPEIKIKTKLQQWKNTIDVLKWFQSIKNKNTFTFIKYDVVEFYPNISKQLLMDSFKFAKKYVNISDFDINTIIHSCKTVLIYKNEAWVKKDSSEDYFDIPMGSHHGAEICELVGLYILNELSTIIPKNNCGIYRDDGLLITKKRSARLIESLRKDITKIFQKLNLQVKIELSSQSVNFLDVVMDLNNNNYHPYRKKKRKRNICRLQV